MFVAISQRYVRMEKRENRDALEITYPKYFETFGVTLIPIPNVPDKVEGYFSKIPVKAIILSSGNDVNPMLYGKNPQNEDFSEDRDNTEKKLIQIAIKRKLPLLGICRGMQFINVYFEGSLARDIKTEIGVNHVGATHAVNVVDKKLSDFLGKAKFKVNSYHNQGITKKTLSSKLRAFAVTEDGSIEGIYHPKYPIAGVMWHPEREGCNKEANKKLVKAFVEGKLFWK